ncbi:MAG TPA: alpha-(1-_3)-arabinofuranosyltransferase family protein, partial [Jatrophihabitans sp.]|nr:alpha-(1->3)-arabinofuranosyltransferase family protein [Jatrophihabitans sp.]
MTTSQLLSRLIPDDPADPPRPEATAPVRRLRLLLVTLALALLVFAQNAGSTEADTKFDLVVSPWRFLSRALRLWDPIGGAGQLQNQAYGYLFPMGPFFGVLHAINVPPWEIQRAWQTALVVAAFLGVYRLSQHFGSTGFWPRVAAGLCYALAPRMISELSTISSELLPVAALPWILLPLVTGARSGSPRRSAARSGIGLLCAGGVNAAAALAVLPVPALWLLTRSRGPRRAALIRWWLVAVVLASLWWLLPLLVLGKYSPPFLDWIESASTTTLPTSLVASLRGVDHWESYLGAGVWPGAWILASASAAILATAAVAGIGLAGMAGRSQPHRDFLWTSLLLGLVLVTLGHLAPVGPPFASQLQQLLDGPLVAFRNLHKFDPLIRLPLALGFGAFLGRARLPRWWRVPTGRLPLGRLLVPARAVGLLAACAIGAVAITPMLTNQSVASPRVTTEPGWWVETGQWLAEHADGSRALLVPASTSPVYLWGGTVDTALQPVASTPWTVRDAVPLAQAGYIRLLDSITTMLAAGRPDLNLAALLNRSGIGFLVVANDLNTYRSGATPLMLLHATIDDTPGFTRMASFGPDVGSAGSGANKLLDGGASIARPSVQIYRVRAPDTAEVAPGQTPLVSVEPLSQAVAANGTSDQLGSLVRAGLAADRPVLFDADAAAAGLPASQRVLTDGIRKRQASFGNAFATSATMTAGQSYTGHRAAYDYLPVKAGPLSVMTYRSISDITASSSGSDIGAYFNRGPANSPFAAVDGDANTAWHSGAPSGAVGQWLQLGFDQPISASTVAIQFVAAGRFTPNRVTVRTDRGSILQPVQPDDSVQLLRLPAGPTRSLRITVASVEAGGYGTTVGISELNVPGVRPVRLLSVPSTPAPGQLLFSAAPGQRSSCLSLRGRPICDASYGIGGEEDGGINRAIDLTGAGSYLFRPTVVLQPGPTLATALAAGAGIQVTTSSTLAGDPRLLASSLIDHDPTTSWQAARGDLEPQITLTLPKPRTLTGLRLSTDPLAAAASPLAVSVTAGTQHWQGSLPPDGTIEFSSPVKAARVTVTITEATIRQSLSSVSFANSLLPVGISEISLAGPGQPLPDPTSQVRLGCSAGLALTVDGNRLPLSVTASRADVLAGRPVLARPCSAQPVALAAGAHSIELASTPLARADAIRASSDELPAGLGLSAEPTRTSAPRVLSWQATARAISVPAGPASILQIRENQNDGWQASLNGHRL